jgi:hypothetical protein
LEFGRLAGAPSCAKFAVKAAFLTGDIIDRRRREARNKRARFSWRRAIGRVSISERWR